jgi:pyruvate/2-oxoglutarate dehydrogenase complex dihydrolipoamide acyltransferase (E2) component
MAERVFTLPDLGEGLEEAIVSAWLVAEGATVELNQPFVEIETAKATVEVPSPFAGRVARFHVAAGETLAVGAPLATFEVEAAAEATSVTAAPAVRKLARDLGVDLSMVTGSGPGGRVTREDVESLARSGVRAASYPGTLPSGGPATARTVGSNTSSEEIPVSPIRRAVAQRLSEVAAIPQVTTFRTVECTALDAVRRNLGVSPLPVFVRALSEVVRDHPMLNATWTDEALLVHDKVNVGIATDTERGLVVPVVMDAGSLGIGEIASEIDRLARAAREGSLKPTNTSGETIAVTNTGSYGSEFGTPLLNPGHAVTIALGVIAARAIVIDGAVEARPACTVSLTFDHRVLDGATVGRAFGALVELLESRERLDALPR